MKILAISDTHGQHRKLKLPKSDLVLHAGDISQHGDRREVEDFLDWFGKLPHPCKIFVAGNHDFYLERSSPGSIKKMLPSSVAYLLDEELVVGGIKIWGSPYTPRFYRWAFNKQRGAALAEQWKKIPADVDILLTHGPAYGLLDLNVDEQHTGDKQLLQKILEVKPKVHVCGHIHEGYGYTKRHGIKFINACVLDEQDQLAHKPILFSIDGR